MNGEEKLLDESFFARETTVVARDLLDKVLVREIDGQKLWGRLVEVEAYLGPQDIAAHSKGGRRTPRTEVMFGEPGRAYVYFTYGMHWCLNFVTREAGMPQAVLVRALEPGPGVGRCGGIHYGRRADRGGVRVQPQSAGVGRRRLPGVPFGRTEQRHGIQRRGRPVLQLRDLQNRPTGRQSFGQGHSDHPGCRDRDHLYRT